MNTWIDAPMVFVTAPACPVCLSVKPMIIRSEQGGDGSTSRKCVCRRCSSRFVLVIEPPLPEFGRAELDDD
ncbi:MAG TPA: hypothetical protein QF564_07255 [Pirellulaceae bacterium]|nr:hypothetical protein [Pirellulaceae bacterium]